MVLRFCASEPSCLLFVYSSYHPVTKILKWGFGVVQEQADCLVGRIRIRIRLVNGLHFHPFAHPRVLQYKWVEVSLINFNSGFACLFFLSYTDTTKRCPLPYPSSPSHGFISDKFLKFKNCDIWGITSGCNIDADQAVSLCYCRVIMIFINRTTTAYFSTLSTGLALSFIAHPWHHVFTHLSLKNDTNNFFLLATHS